MLSQWQSLVFLLITQRKNRVEKVLTSPLVAIFIISPSSLLMRKASTQPVALEGQGRPRGFCLWEKGQEFRCEAASQA